MGVPAAKTGRANTKFLSRSARAGRRRPAGPEHFGGARVTGVCLPRPPPAQWDFTRISRPVGRDPTPKGRETVSGAAIRRSGDSFAPELAAARGGSVTPSADRPRRPGRSGPWPSRCGATTGPDAQIPGRPVAARQTARRFHSSSGFVCPEPFERRTSRFTSKRGSGSLGESKSNPRPRIFPGPPFRHRSSWARCVHDTDAGQPGRSGGLTDRAERAVIGAVTGFGRHDTVRRTSVPTACGRDNRRGAQRSRRGSSESVAFRGCGR
jgi:hypothetical protein